MSRLRSVALVAALLCAVGAADARPGGGSSLGSRGSHTWSAPPRTNITPGWSRPMDRSMTPSPNPNTFNTPNQGFNAARPAVPPYNTMGARPSFGARHPFMTGFAGGFLGAGLFGMLSGHGFFGGFTGGTSLFGFLLQALILGGLIIFLLRLFGNRSKANNGATPNSGAFNAPQSNAPYTPTNEDYTAFQQLLLDIQSAWSAQNMRALSNRSTPEMAGYFNEQLSELASRGARNIVSNVQFQRGDLSEAWRENGLTYATVAMRYSLTDVTTDNFGNVIDGSSTDMQTVTELWTFVRADGRGNWILSAIQQAG
ncbi:mitochondrial import inner membrane translocase subunit Tim44 [Neokomagataea thailandica NBRC 106555]|uniref:Tim44 domain-containing protein n=2 Tax=Neokomagataea TaxID=1223423 RepID=A0A4Y6V8E5_9PROT|nr:MULTISPECIES: TIM44-like domain-containing protein [Neokomagataea]QDH25148.1 Tim44 domain-containing protein [Neokomagataea tanensis]GBR52024.1 mitochondrial import inner membrane translocase subunit Tim44 [Neokomagataea thailandica NBRC 106555]